MSELILHMHDKDAVAIALQALAADQQITDQVCCREDIPAGHKVALTAIAKGDVVYKYGQQIGIASTDIEAGEHVHVHNLQFQPVAAASNTPEQKSAHHSSHQPSQKPSSQLMNSDLTFDGYHRADGQVGTRNYIGVMATVNCSATVVARIAKHFSQHPLLEQSNIDGIVPITHQSGCGIAGGDSNELSLLQRVLTGYLKNPNFYAWVVVGLGCEVNQTKSLVDANKASFCVPVHTLDIQGEGGTTAATEKGIAQIEALLQEAAKCQRQPAPLSALKVGLQCGGSDGWSGVTANPALGAAVNHIVNNGGSAILAETPEIYGAEQLLLARAANSDIAESLVEKIDWWKDYLAQHNQTMNNNPSPGNLAGGITTILEKSLGAVAKSGTSTLQGVLSYAESASTRGLLFMDSPGFDPCSVTGEIAAGANLICFTTGRGSTFGAAGAPTLKLASNHQLYTRMSDDMDVDCGAIASGDASIEQIGEDIFQTIIDTASGRLTASEKLGLGEYEFVPWAIGAVV